MASPYSTGPAGGGWPGNPAASPHHQNMPTPNPSDRDEYGPQTRPMGVKVLYSLKDSLDNLLARWPQVQQVQTIPIDETNSIGVINLSLCLQAIFQCSPELFDQTDLDYTVYAFDYSEIDTPLVGQGMFSWGLQPAQPNEAPKMVTGRVTKNLMGVFGGGPKETLEVKLKLASVPRRQRADQRTDYAPGNMGMASYQAQQPNQLQQQQQQQQQQQYQSLPHQQHQPQTGGTSTPTDTSEWTSFIQSNPALARSASSGAPYQPNQPPSRNSYHPMQAPGSRPGSRPGSVSAAPPHAPSPGTSQQTNSTASAHPMPSHLATANHSQEQQQLRYQAVPHSGAPSFSASRPRTGTPDVLEPNDLPVAKPSRPSSRARSRVPTGRPRGRPRKKPVADGNTSGLEDPTDADDGPRRKRAKTTQADWSDDRPSLDSTSDSLRVVAAISGSIRSIRPVGTAGEGIAANHLHEGPRAPTPVPQALHSKKSRPRKKLTPVLPRHDSTASTDYTMGYSSLHADSSFNMQNQNRLDARSPTESVAASEQVYTPEESPADIGSSPPVPRSTAFIGGSSPVVSSPVLPRMLSNPRHDSGFMSGGIDGGLDDDDAQTLPPQKPQQPTRREPSPKLPKIAKPVPRKADTISQAPDFPFMEEIPGPQELLPQTSLYNPPRGQAHKLNKPRQPTGAVGFHSTNSGSNEPGFQRSSATEALAKKSASPPIDLLSTANKPLPSVEESPAKTPCDQPIEASYTQGREEPKESTQETPRGSTQELDRQGVRETSHGPLNTDLPKASANEIPDIQLQALLEATSGPEPELPLMPSLNPPTSRPMTSTAPDSRVPAVAASDPVGPQMSLTLPLPPVSYSEAPCPPSDAFPEQTTSNKNYAKKQTIKERLQQAIEQGEMPPFCSNCGAIETPTWRKMWTQDHVGSPGFHDYSEKPGLVTAIDILERDADDNPISYRLVKKSLGPGEDKAKWKKSLICNPCGIWLGKFKCHRPQEQWDKNLTRLNQPRRKRDKSASGSNSRAKKPRTKSDAQLNLTSEACLMTDPLGPSGEQTGEETVKQPTRKEAKKIASLSGSPNPRGPGSTHSRGSGTAHSPIAVEEDLGPARRLLFPSPRKDGIPKVLGEMAVNIVKVGPDAAGAKDLRSTAGQRVPVILNTPPKGHNKEEMADLFGTPPARPSTPPSGSCAGPFKTPTRHTPSHRPITRSVSRSIRSHRGVAMVSPMRGLGNLQQTPSRTPGRAHFALDDLAGGGGLGDSPFPTTLSQLLSEANEFTNGSPSHGLGDLHAFDLGSAMLDFGLGADLPLPSSPPLAFKEACLSGYDPSWDLPDWSQTEHEGGAGEVAAAAAAQQV